MTKFDYEILCEKLNPAIGGLRRYAAKVILTRRGDDGKASRVLDHGLGEVWANTEEEAIQKMRQAVELWIKQQTLTVCAHSLGTGLPIEVAPGERHTCKELANSPGSTCHCDPVEISREEFERQKIGFK